MTRIGIVGMGVMGGSLLLALDEKYEAHVVSRGAPGRDWAMHHGARSAHTHASELPEDLDFIFLTSPSSVLAPLAEALAQRPVGPIISDMASTKGEVVPQLTEILKDHPYLSCHPMCGSEKTGLEGAARELYQGKKVLLTPGGEQAENLIPAMGQFWENLGCCTLRLSPVDHDRAVAWVSHMPHLAIPAMVHAIDGAQREGGSIFETAGTGLRDISRLAGSNPELWRDIVWENRSACRESLQGLVEALNRCQKLLDLDDEGEALETFLREAKDIRLLRELARI